jgi:hypothetical protein
MSVIIRLEAEAEDLQTTGSAGIRNLQAYHTERGPCHPTGY